MLLNRCPVTAGSWIVSLLCAEVLTKPVNGRGGAVCADVTSWGNGEEEFEDRWLGVTFFFYLWQHFLNDGLGRGPWKEARAILSKAVISGVRTCGCLSCSTCTCE